MCHSHTRAGAATAWPSTSTRRTARSPAARACLASRVYTSDFIGRGTKRRRWVGPGGAAPSGQSQSYRPFGACQPPMCVTGMGHPWVPASPPIGGGCGAIWAAHAYPPEGPAAPGSAAQPQGTVGSPEPLAVSGGGGCWRALLRPRTCGAARRRPGWAAPAAAPEPTPGAALDPRGAGKVGTTGRGTGTDRAQGGPASGDR